MGNTGINKLWESSESLNTPSCEEDTKVPPASVIESGSRKEDESDDFETPTSTGSLEYRLASYVISSKTTNSYTAV